jgi:hypothetical protein
MQKSALVEIAMAVAACLFTCGGMVVHAADGDVDVQSACTLLPSHGALRSALVAAQMQMNGGFGLNMWGTVVNRDGIVCAVAFTGSTRGDQWPGAA